MSLTASNPLRGEAPLVLLGRDYVLVFDVNAWCYAERELGLASNLIIDRYFAPNPPLDVVRVLLWAGLQEHLPCTVKEVGTMLSDAGSDGLKAAKAAINDGLLAAFGQATGDKEGTDPPPGEQAGTGSPSSKTGAPRATRRKASGGKRRG